MVKKVKTELLSLQRKNEISDYTDQYPLYNAIYSYYLRPSEVLLRMRFKIK